MNRPNDQPARTRAIDPAFSCIVQAPAGSGKTELLTRRILTLLAQVEQPEEILAITFTRKAASEMRQRVFDVLSDAENKKPVDDDYAAEGRALADAVLKRDAEQKWSLLENPSRLQLQTIDSLCAVLTRSLPVTSNFGASLAVVEDASSYYQTAAQRCLESCLESISGEEGTDALSTLMVHLDNNLERLQRMMADMLANRDQWLRHYGSVSGSREAMEADLFALVGQRFDSLEQLRPSVLDDRIVPLLHHIAAAAQGLDLPIDYDIFEATESIPAASMESAEFWRKLSSLLLTKSGDFRKKPTRAVGVPTSAKDAEALGAEVSELRQVKDDLIALLDSMSGCDSFRLALHQCCSLPTEGYQDQQWNILESLLELLLLCVAELHLVFSEKGQVDFSEIAMRASTALGALDEPSDLALALDYRIHHILVDEFQDTSESQFALFEQLVAGWEPGDGRTFFAVGDPMQSIYLFRDAEVSLFLKAAAFGIGDVPLESLTLESNFRSDPAVVDWCNESFTELFPTESDIASGAVSYSRASAFRQPVDQSGFQMHGFPGKDRREEASRVTMLIRDALDQQNGPESIAILVRTKSALGPVFAALQSASIDYQAIDIETLGDRLVVRDIVSLCRALQHPHDRISWLSVLRAPFCGLKLDDLHTLVDDAQRMPIWTLLQDEDRLARLSADAVSRVKRLRSILEPALQHASADRLVPWLESTWIRLGGPVGCRTDVDRRAADRCFALLGSIAEDGLLWNQDYIDDRLQQLYAPVSSVESRVQIMTIHKSKGLEFDMVVLPGLGLKARVETGGLLNWIECRSNDGESRLVMAPIDPAGTNDLDRDPILKFVNTLRKEKSSNELTRLLYVATTRARYRLHLLGNVDFKPDDTVREPGGQSLLGILWSRVASVFDDLTPSSEEDVIPVAARASELSRLTASSAVPDLSEHWITNDNIGTDLPGLESDLTEGLTTTTSTGEPVRPDFEWAGIEARLSGTVIHRQIERISKDGLAQWSVERVKKSLPFFSDRLRALGVAPKALDDSAQKVVRALCNLLEDPRGRWLLEDHREQASELRVTGLVQDQLVNGIIDRTFVDADGLRWIVDFKSGEHRGGSPDTFLDREQVRYRAQIEHYATVLKSIHSQPIRLGLYFPLMKGWREWSADDS